MGHQVLTNPALWISIISWAAFVRLVVFHWKDSEALVRFIDETNPDIWDTLSYRNWPGLGPYTLRRRMWVIDQLTFGLSSRKLVLPDAKFSELVLNARISMWGVFLFFTVALIATVQLPLSIPRLPH
jgi:hypothetical protein